VILVTGGTGHLGTELVPYLLSRGHQVRVLTRDPDRARNRIGSDVELARGDAQDPETLRPALQGVEAVISAMTGFGPGAPGPLHVDYRGNLNLIHEAQKAGVRRFMLLSMHRAAADHPMELGRMKHRAEGVLRASSLEWVIVRPTVLMEVWAGIIGDAVVSKGKATVFGRGDNPINFVSARDVARLVELAACDRGLNQTSIDVGGPENLTFNQLVDRIRRSSGKKAAVRHVPLPVMRISALLMRSLRPDIAGLVQAGIAFDTLNMSFDPSGLRKRFPQIELTAIDEVLNARLPALARKDSYSISG
jgi:NADH dehydrogenase